ncbi:hypothetical protein [Flavobacterium sp. SM2513]|uniref:hypothetical protein n=1 Tax=Flavobacterium sp. SM2513 TaxID=3424766 RepID=UPI003D7F8CDA
MKHKLTFQNHTKFAVLFCLLLGFAVNAQIGIGTTEPDVSSMLDVSSTAKGMLTPRMSKLQREAIVTPANGLMVFDTDLKLFHYYISGSGWTPINSPVNGRQNFKRIKATDVLSTVLADELIAGGGTKYKLNTTTLYEVNGSVSFNKPIDLNNAYLQGLDTGNDQILASGNIFDGSTGGTVKGLTLASSGGKVFNLTGAATENLIFRDCIVANSSSVGSISGFGLVFISIVQFSGNTSGITYNNITQLLLSNLGWFGNNVGTFEKLTGTFNLVQKQGGFSEVNGTAVGFDVSGNPTISGDAIMSGHVYTGTNSLGYINPYPLANRYVGYNFSNAWTVDSPGIPREGDAESTGDINLDAAVGSGALTSFSGSGSGSRKKINGTTTSNNLFRFTRDGDNKITYKGNKKRYFQVAGAVSYQATDDLTVILYIAKNGVVITETKVYGRGATGYFTNAGILALPIVGTVELKKNDYIEIWAERFSGAGNMTTVSLNLIVR